MARKNFYYVLVLTEDGPVFVTNVPRRNYAEWDFTKEPLCFEGYTYAESIAYGLSSNYANVIAYPIKLTYELTAQPYRYSKGHFEWVKND